MLFFYLLFLLPLLATILYWLLVTTEGVFLGRRMVVWLYDITAHKYEGIKEFDAEAERFFVVRPLLYRLRQHPAPRILDVASGTGRLPRYVFREPRFNGRFILIEPSGKMIAIAERNLRPFLNRLLLVQQTAVPLPIRSDSVDAATCLEALEFFPDDKAALAEMFRALKPGGILLTTRRKGREGRAFLHRFRDQDRFEQMLLSLGFHNVTFHSWQVDYELIFAEKPPA